MSEVIDEKVVEMRFNNQQFEKGVSQTMTSLDRLKSSLKMDNLHTGLSNLSNELNRVNFSNLEKSAGLSQKALGLVSDTINTIKTGFLLKIGSDVENWAKRTIDAMGGFSTMAKGFDKFGEKTMSVATITSQGFGLEEVNEQMERLLWFTDETSYNFVDMTREIGKFTATGQDLETSVTAMEGIATWAALSGQNAQAASRAMYNISQAMSAGAMKLQDWKSIQNVSMDTQEFRQNAIEAAIAAGTLIDAGNGLYKVGNKTFDRNSLFGDGLKYAWLNTDAMMNVFNKYSSAVSDIYEYAEKHGITASEAIEEMGDSLDEFGLKAFLAAQQARTWGDVVDSVVDAVSTGWMTTFEQLIGNSKEATALFTTLANQFYDIFATAGNKRNEVLDAWRNAEVDGQEIDGRTEALKALTYVVTMLYNAVTPCIEAFHEVFDILKEDQFDDTTETVLKTAKEVEKLGLKTEDLNEVIDEEGNKFYEVKEEVTAYENYIQALGNKLAETTIKIKDFLKSMAENVEVMKNIKILFVGIFSVIKLVRDQITDFVKAFFGLNEEVGSSIVAFTRIGKVVGTFLFVIAKVLEKTKLAKALGTLIVTVIKSIYIVLTSLFNAIARVTGHNNGLELFVDLCQKLAIGIVYLTNLIVALTNGISKFFTAISRGDFSVFVNMFYNIGGFIAKGLGSGIAGGFVSVFETIGKCISGMVAYACNLLGIHSPSRVFFEIGKYILQGLIMGIQFVEPYLGPVMKNVAEKLVEGLTYAIGAVSKVADIQESLFNKIFSNNSFKALSYFGDILKSQAKKLVDFGLSLDFARVRSLVFMASIYMIGKSMLNTSKAVQTFATSFAGVGKSISGFFGEAKSAVQAFKENMIVKKDLPILMQFAILVGVLAASLFTLSKIPADDLQRVSEILMSFLFAITVFSGAMTAIGAAFTHFVEIDASKIVKGIEVLSKVAITLAACLGVLAFSVTNVAIALKIISTIPAEKMDAALDTVVQIIWSLSLSVIAMIGVLTFFATLAEGTLPAISKMVGTMIAITAAIGALAISTLLLSLVPPERLAAATGAITVLMLGLVAVSAIAKGVSIGAILGLVVMVGLLAATIPIALGKLADLSSGQMIGLAIASIIGISLLLTLSVGMMMLMDKFGPNIQKFGAGMLMLSASFLIMSGVIAILQNILPEDIAKGIVTMVVMGAFLVVFSALVSSIIATNNLSKKGMLGMVAIGAVITGMMFTCFLLAGLSAIMQFIDWGGIVAALTMYGVVIFAYTRVLKAAEGLKGTSTGSLIVLATSIFFLFLELIVISQLPYTDILVAGGTMALVLVAFGYVLQQTAALAANSKAASVLSLIAIVAILGVLMFSLYSLAETFKDSPETLVTAMLSMVGCMAALALLFEVIGKMNADWGKVGMLFVSIGMIGAIAGSLAMLAAYPWESIAAAGAAMAVTLLTLSLAMSAASALTGPAIGGMIVAMAGFIAIAGALMMTATAVGWFADNIAKFANIEWESMGKAAAVIGGILLAFSLAGSVAPLIMLTSVALLVASGALAAIVGVLYLASPAIDLLSEALIKMSSVDMGSIASYLPAVALALAGLAIVSPALLLAGVGLNVVALGFSTLSKSAVILGPALLLLQAVNLGTIASGLMQLSVAGLTLIAGAVGFSLAAAALALAAPAMLTFAAASTAASFAMGQGMMLGVATLPAEMMAAGFDAAMGLINGTTSALPMVSTIGGLLGSSFLLGFRATTGWHSPWSTTNQAGIDGDDGLIQGTASKLGDVAKAGAALGQAELDGYDSVGVSDELKKRGEENSEALETETKWIEYLQNQLATGDEKNIEQVGELAGKYLTMGKISQEQYDAIKKSASEMSDSQIDAFNKGQAKFQEWLKYEEQSNEELQQHLAENKFDFSEVTRSSVKSLNDGFEKYVGKELIPGLGVQGTQAGVEFGGNMTEQIMKELNGIQVNPGNFMEQYFGSDDTSIDAVYSVSTIVDHQKAGDFDKWLTKEGWKKDEKGNWKRHHKGAMEIDFGDGNKTEDFAKNLGDIGDAADATKEKTKELNEVLQDSIKIFDEFNDATDITSSQLIKNLDSQLNGMERWASTLASLKGTIDDELYDTLVDEGTSGYAKVNAIADMNTAQREYYNMKYKKTAEQAKRSADMLKTGIKEETAEIKINNKYVYMATKGNEKFIAAMQKYGDKVGKRTKETEAMSKSLGTYANALMKANEEGDVQTETVKAMAAQFIKANPAIAKMGITVDDVYESLMEMTTGMEDVKKAISKQVKDSIKIFEKWNDKFELTSDQVLENMHSQVRGITKWAGQLKELAAKGLDSSMLAYLQHLGPEGAEYVNAFAQMSAEELKDAGETYKHAMDLGDEVSDELVDSYAKAGYFLSEGFAEGIVNGTTESDESVMSMGTSALEKLQLVLDEHSPSRKTYEMGYNYVAGFSNGISENTNLATSATTKLGQIINNGLKQTVSETEGRNIGENLIRGLNIGMNNAANTVRSGVVKVANGITNALRNALGVHSPSTVFAEIGRYCNEGLAVGLETYSKLAYAASEDVAGETMNGFTDTYSGISSIIDWDDLNPVITPTLDLSEVTDGVRDLNTMMDEQASIKAGTNIDENQNGAGNRGITFIQNNNSPKALDRIEIYRQTKNQLSSMGGAFA